MFLFADRLVRQFAGLADEVFHVPVFAVELVLDDFDEVAVPDLLMQISADPGT